MKDIILLNFNPQFAVTEIFTPQRNSNSLEAEAKCSNFQLQRSLAP